MRALCLLTLVALTSCQCSTPGGQPPTVRIVTPTDWTYLDGAGPHAVSGEVTDPDEIIQPDRVVWRSDRDGAVGRGAITTITLSPGEHRLTLEATDRDGNTASAQVSVYVRLSGQEDGGVIIGDAGTMDGGTNPDGGATDTAPVATITSPANASLVDEGQAIELLGSATDLEDGVLTGGALVWTSDRAGVIGSGARVSFTNAALGAHRIVLTATDRAGRTGIASIALTVVRPGTNRPPVVTIAAPVNGALLVLGTAAMLRGTAADVEDGALTGASMVWTSSLDGALGTGAMLAPMLTQGVHTLTLTATDSMGATGTASVTVSVNQPNNQPPTATITQPAMMQTLFQGTMVTFAGAGTDPEDGALTGMSLSWTSSRDGVLGTGSPLTNSSLTVGDHTITLVARDAGGNSGTASVLVRVLPQNQAPTVTITAPAANTSVAAGTTIAFTGTATDPEDGTLSGSSVRWSSSRDGALGTGVSFSTGALSVGAHTITLTATDAGGRSGSASIAVTVTMSAMNVPPLARLTGPGTGQATDTLAFDGSTSSDTDGTVVSYRFDFGDGTMPVSSMMPTAAHAYTAAGTYTVTLTVTDDRGATASATLQLVVSPFVRVPTVALPAVDDVGRACAIATPGSRVFLAWTSSRHPGLFFGERVNGTLQVEVVDALGFNTGGVINQHVSMQVEPNGTPHLVYLREGTVMYATKSGGTWLRERVDASNVALATGSVSGTSESFAPSIALVGSSPVVLFLTGVSYSSYRPVIATRTGANTWTRSTVTVPGYVTTDGHYSIGELVIDPSGRHLFPVSGYISNVGSTNLLVAWTSSSTTTAPLPSLNTRGDAALVSATRMLLRTDQGLLDVALNATFPSTTLTSSSVELNTTQEGDVAWSASQGRPVLLHLHGSSLELVTPNAAGFWTYTQLGSATSASAGLAVNPTTGEASIYYQANSRIIFQ